MSSKSFRTAVLCRYRAGGDYGSTLACVNWLLDLVRPSKVDLVLARGSGMPTVRSVKSAFLDRLRDAVEDAAVESVLLSVPESSGAGYRLSFFLEKRREKDLVEYLRFLLPEAPKAADEVDRVKLVSCSIAQSLVSERLRRQGENVWTDHWKRMFVDLDAVCGYVTRTDLPLTSVFTIAPGQSGRTSAAGSRIYDVDYRACIDGAYEDNFLSLHHLRRVPDLQERLEVDGTLETEPIEAWEGRLCGLRVRPREGSPWGARRLAGLLGDLVHRPASGTERSFLLLSHDEVAAAGGAGALKAKPGKALLSELPHGFVQIEESAVIVPEDYLKRTAMLQSLYGPIYPGVQRGKVYAHELMERFEGLFDRRSIFFRIPTGKPEGRSLLMYFASPELDLEHLTLHLLVRHDLAPADLAQVESIIKTWLAGVAGHPDAYGSLEQRGSISVTELPGGKDIHWAVSALHLRQEAINLLVLLVDELNRARFRVPYLVFGEIQEL
jgi:hypothetical protein